MEKEVLKYEGKTLIGIYEVKSTNNKWYENRILINSQEEYNRLVYVCNHYDTMNLIKFIEKD